MRSSAITRPVLATLGGGLLATALIGAIVTVAQQRAAVNEAVAGAREITSVVAREVVTPTLTDAELAHPAPGGPLDTVVRQRVLSNDIVRVKIWSADGTVLYSDLPSLIGRRFGLRAHEQQALRNGAAAAELLELDAPENATERSFGKLIEVYLRVETASGRPLLFETYQRYGSVADTSRTTLNRFLPALLGGLGLLFLSQVPLVVSLARRVEASQRRQSDLLAKALDASDAERRRIAANLHDGVVQGLAGASYTLSATAERADSAGLEGEATALRGVAVKLRQWVRELRTLVLDITPPRLHEAGLQPALADLVSTLRARGVDAELHAHLDGGLDREREALLFRVAQEAVRNVAQHATASHATLTVTTCGSAATLEVTDDGVGFTEDHRTARRDDGHLGLDLLEDLARAHGGALTVTSTPGAGTSLRLEVP